MENSRDTVKLILETFSNSHESYHNCILNSLDESIC